MFRNIKNEVLDFNFDENEKIFKEIVPKFLSKLKILLQIYITILTQMEILKFLIQFIQLLYLRADYDSTCFKIINGYYLYYIADKV